MEDDLPDYNALDSMASPSSQYGDTSSEYGMSSPGPAPGPSAPAFDSADGDGMMGYYCVCKFVKRNDDPSSNYAPMKQIHFFAANVHPSSHSF